MAIFLWLEVTYYGQKIIAFQKAKVQYWQSSGCTRCMLCIKWKELSELKINQIALNCSVGVTFFLTSSTMARSANWDVNDFRQQVDKHKWH